MNSIIFINAGLKQTEETLGQDHRILAPTSKHQQKLSICHTERRNNKRELGKGGVAALAVFKLSEGGGASFIKGVIL
jgi:hypothetical protein